MSNLSEVSYPGVFRIHAIEDRGEETLRLKRLGICENRTLEVLHVGDPMIVRVVGTRIGISRAVARCISVELLGAESAIASPVEGAVPVGAA